MSFVLLYLKEVGVQGGAPVFHLGVSLRYLEVSGGRCFQRQQVSMRSQEERSRLKKSSEETLGYVQLLKRWKAVVE